jgi:tetratricopeptide (TPR) repeat protein
MMAVLQHGVPADTFPAMMRLAIVAAPAAMPDLRPAPGALDGDALRSRLLLPDAGYHVVELDPAIDLAEQLELFFEQTPLEPGTPALFYASARVAASAEGELFLCLDPESPETGDSLRDIATVIRDRIVGPVAFVIECRHPVDEEDPFRSATIVGAAKDSLRGVGASGAGVELLVAARPLREDTEERTSPLTRALIEALDEVDPDVGLSLASFFEKVRDSDALVGVVPCFAHVKARDRFILLEGTGAQEATESAATSEEASAATSEEASSKEAPVSEAEPISEVEPISAVAPIIHEAPVAEPATAGEDLDESIQVDLEGPMSAPAPVAPPVREPVVVLPLEPEARRVSSPPRALPEDRSFRAENADAALPKVMIAEPRVVLTPPKPVASEAKAARPPSVPAPSPSVPAPSPSVPAPSSVVPARSPSVPAPSPSIPAPSPIVPARSPSVPAPSPSVPAPSPSVPAPSPSIPAPSPSIPAPSPSIPAPSPSMPAPGMMFADHVAEGDRLQAGKDHEGALSAYKRALGMLGPAASVERADIHVRIGQLKQAQEKRREAIASFEKALSISSGHLTALTALLDLNVAEGDLRAIQVAEDRVLATMSDPLLRFGRLMEFGARWQDQAGDLVRARATFERAAELRPDDLGVLSRLQFLYEQAGAVEDTIYVRRRLAKNTKEARPRAEQLFALGVYLLDDLKREEAGLELFDEALAADPSMLEPLAVIARFFADRQEWSELELAYRRMLERAPRIPDPVTRSQVTWELCRLLGTLFRDHLEDPALALDAFEDAVSEKPREIQSRLTAAELARSIGAFDRAAVHLQAAAAIEPSRLATFHQLFDLFQKLRLPDQAYSAACITMIGRKAESRERFVYEEHKPDGVPKFVHAMREGGWDLLRARGRDVNLEAVLEAIAPAAIAAKLAQLEGEGLLPELDPEARQDPAKTTLSIVRSFTWASHYLGVAAPVIYLHDDAEMGLASIIAAEPTALAGGLVLRGRTLPELAFLAGRHLAYHVGGHELMLYYPSIEELSTCFLAAVKIALPDLPLPPSAAPAVNELVDQIEPGLDEATRERLTVAVAGFESARVRADIAGWVGAVERCATRAGFLLAGDLEIVAGVLRSDPLGLISADDKIADLVGFMVSEEHHALREELGIAIQP